MASQESAWLPSARVAPARSVAASLDRLHAGPPSASLTPPLPTLPHTTPPLLSRPMPLACTSGAIKIKNPNYFPLRPFLGGSSCCSTGAAEEGEKPDFFCCCFVLAFARAAEGGHGIAGRCGRGGETGRVGPVPALRQALLPRRARRRRLHRRVDLPADEDDQVPFDLLLASAAQVVLAPLFLWFLFLGGGAVGGYNLIIPGWLAHQIGLQFFQEWSCLGSRCFRYLVISITIRIFHYLLVFDTLDSHKRCLLFFLFSTSQSCLFLPFSRWEELDRVNFFRFQMGILILWWSSLLHWCSPRFIFPRWIRA